MKRQTQIQLIQRCRMMRLAAELTDRERKQIAALESARADWQARLARRIASLQSGAR